MNTADAKSWGRESWERRLERNHEFQAKAFQLHSVHSGRPNELELQQERVAGRKIPREAQAP